MTVFKKLSEVTVGKRAIIRSFTLDDIHVKLMEMGCIPGEIIQVENIAPLKDPISVLISGYQLSLRLIEADHIIVEEVE
jgi:ferrous iron transport protein A